MPGNRNFEDELFDDIEAEEERLAVEEQAELDSEDGGDDDKEIDPVEAMHRIIGELQAEIAEIKDKMLRTVAEMENLRRRTGREVIDAKIYSTANFARDMLSVSDNLRRAIDAIPEETRAEDNAGLTALIEGVEMTERAMLTALEKNGVKKLDPKGEKFDPHFHQAIFEVENTDVPNNTVIEVVQDGYVIGERVLRPAMVGVAKGGPKVSATENEATDEQVADTEMAEDSEKSDE